MMSVRLFVMVLFDPYRWELVDIHGEVVEKSEGSFGSYDEARAAGEAARDERRKNQ